MNPEEADNLEKRIEKLKSIGWDLYKELSTRAQTDKEKTYPLEVWLGEIASLIKTAFKDNPALVTKIDQLVLPANSTAVASGTSDDTAQNISSDVVQSVPPQPGAATSPPSGTTAARIKSPSPVPNSPSEIVLVALDLLSTAEKYIFVDHISSASESLRTLIATTLRDDLYNSWTIRTTMIVLGFVIVLICGGTAFSLVQVQGVADRAAQANKNIESSEQTVAAKLKEVTSAANVKVDKLEGRLAEIVEKEIPGKVNSAITNDEPKIQKAISDQVKSRIDGPQEELSNDLRKAKQLHDDFQAQLPESVKLAEAQAGKFNNYFDRYKNILTRLSEGTQFSGLQGVATALGVSYWLIIASPLIALAALLLACLALAWRGLSAAGELRILKPAVTVIGFILAMTGLVYIMSYVYIAVFGWIGGVDIAKHLHALDYLEIPSNSFAIIGIVAVPIVLIIILLCIQEKLLLADRPMAILFVVLGLCLICAALSGAFHASEAKHVKPSLILLESSGTPRAAGVSEASRYASLRGALLFQLTHKTLLWQENTNQLISVPSHRIQLIETPASSVSPEGSSTEVKPALRSPVPVSTNPEPQISPTTPTPAHTPAISAPPAPTPMLLSAPPLVPSPSLSPLPTPTPVSSTPVSSSPSALPERSRSIVLPKPLLPIVPWEWEQPLPILTLIPSPAPIVIPPTPKSSPAPKAPIHAKTHRHHTSHKWAPPLKRNEKAMHEGAT
jgi:hypothetical protein